MSKKYCAVCNTWYTLFHYCTHDNPYLTGLTDAMVALEDMNRYGRDNEYVNFDDLMTVLQSMHQDYIRDNPQKIDLTKPPAGVILPHRPTGGSQ